MRPKVLSVAGFDPSGGAGLLADIKTFENHHVYGFGACTALTVQNENEFEYVKWVDISLIKKQIGALMRNHKVLYVKIGLIVNVHVLHEVISTLRQYQPGIFIIWDPILESGSGYRFHKKIVPEQFMDVCKNIQLITPNIPEIKTFFPGINAEKGALLLSAYCPVLLKGGHRDDRKAVDLLFESGKRHEIDDGTCIANNEKHGTGCVLSSSVLAHLALGDSLLHACKQAKQYVMHYMKSTNDKLGYHIIPDKQGFSVI